MGAMKDWYIRFENTFEDLTGQDFNGDIQDVNALLHLEPERAAELIARDNALPLVSIR